MNKNLYHPYINKNGKKVNANASLLHHIKEIGGIQKYNDSVGAEYIASFIKHHSDEINAEIIAKTNRKQFKIV